MSSLSEDIKKVLVNTDKNAVRNILLIAVSTMKKLKWSERTDNNLKEGKVERKLSWCGNI